MNQVWRHEPASGHPGNPRFNPDVSQADPGIAEVVWSFLPVLDRHGLISGGYEVPIWAGHEPEYTVTPDGEWFLTMLAEPE
jgi:hypothetical protein